MEIFHQWSGADPNIFKKGGGVRRKMFADTRINARTHEN